MREVGSPTVRLLCKPILDDTALTDYLSEIDGMDWYWRVEREIEEMNDDAAYLTEFAGRMCYRSWKPGLNPNVSKVREDSQDYLTNVLRSGHGSVLEHAYFVFLLQDVSRVFTHELVRHRAGVSISQESLRFVRLDDIPFWHPEWARNDEELMRRNEELLQQMEAHQLWMADHFGLDDDGVPFSEKKAKTSYMRRFAPIGLATTMVWGANVRALRHIIEMRTAAGAEEEIRLVFGQVAEICKSVAPMLFADYSSENGVWETNFRKV